jgi:hypothetical protein
MLKTNNKKDFLMSYLNKDASGFSVVELLLVLLTLALICGAGYLVAKHVDTKKTPLTSTASSAKSYSSSTWKTYNWTAEGLTFKYPSSWTSTNPQATSAEQANLQPPTKPNDPYVFLSSPNIVTEKGFDAGSDPSDTDTFTGAFAIDATKDTAANIEQSTDAGSPGGLSPFVYILKVTPFSVPGYKQMWIVEEGEQSNSYADELAITDVPVKVGLTSSSNDDSFQSKNTSADRISFTIGLFSEAKDSPENFAFINVPASTFEALTDYNTALSILKSISY